MEADKETISQIEKLLESYYSRQKEEFIPGKTKIAVGAPVYDNREVAHALRSLLSGWITQGSETRTFEKKFAAYCGTKEGVSVNSGSSANLIALSVLSNGAIKEGERIHPGDEVIVPAATFPTSASPILQINATPAFVDVEPETYNIDTTKLENAITKKTKAIMAVHLFGHPVDMGPLMETAEKHNLKVIEDCADAHGAEYRGKKVGSIGDMGTFSFFIAHLMTTAEGGMITTNNDRYSNLARSLRAFGRACACPVCTINEDPASCALRQNNYDEVLRDYDRRYTFLDLGYSTKMTEVQSSFGIEQLAKLESFIAQRRENAAFLLKKLGKYGELIKLPEEKKWARHVYYGFIFAIQKDAPFRRKDMTSYLESKKIETRPLFGGSLPDQPAFRNRPMRISGDLEVSKWLRDYGFFIGCHPGIGKQECRYIADTVSEFLDKY